MKEGKASRKLRSLAAGLTLKVENFAPVISSSVDILEEGFDLVFSVGDIVGFISDETNSVAKVFKVCLSFSIVKCLRKLSYLTHSFATNRILARY